jgi:catechol 2,3-dioxygenase-like lactoylglutathione lyase family enzyme
MIKIKDIAYVRFSAPDLDAMERFVTDFGLVVAERRASALFARGTDASSYLHVTERGEPGFLGMAFEAASARDLATAATLEGASPVEAIEAPGGGQRVRFRDPDGFGVEIVHGRSARSLPAAPRPAALNRGSERHRFGGLHRVVAGPPAVKRLGHAVVRVADFRRSEQWYKSRFGLLSSDEVYIGDPDNVITAFMRCDRGDEYTDHHTLLCVGIGTVGFDHAAFEVEDLDAVMTGHDHLAKGGYAHHAGVGRHVLGSQIFDYWKDPWGHVVEHFTDGDLLNASHVCERHDPGTALGTQWGRFAP